jgi:hypothetical protein
MVLLPETSVEDAAVLADKLRLIIAGEHHLLPDGGEVSVTISLGVTGAAGDRLSVDALVREADAAMYSAKALGRDQVYAFEEPSDESTVVRSPISPAGRSQAMELGRRAHGAAADALAQIISPLPHYRGQPSALIATIVTTLARQLSLPEHEIDKIRSPLPRRWQGRHPQDILGSRRRCPRPSGARSSSTPGSGRSSSSGHRARDAVPIILHHHERLAAPATRTACGPRDPVGAGIVAIADAYDAMIQDRPYKGKINHEAAITEPAPRRDAVRPRARRDLLRHLRRGGPRGRPGRGRLHRRRPEPPRCRHPAARPRAQGRGLGRLSPPPPRAADPQPRDERRVIAR